MDSRPNIVLIQADQLTSQVLPMYGNNMAIVPNISALANEGITFLNSYFEAISGITGTGFSIFKNIRYQESGKKYVTTSCGIS